MKGKTVKPPIKEEGDANESQNQNLMEFLQAFETRMNEKMQENIQELRASVRDEVSVLQNRMEEQILIQDEKLRGLNVMIGELASRRTSRAPSPPKQDDRIEPRESPLAAASRRSLLPPIFREEEREAELEDLKKRDSIMGGLLRFEEEQTLKAVTERVYVASSKYLDIVWKEKTLDAFMTFLEEIRDFQYAYGQRVPSIFGRIHKDLKDFVADILRHYFPHKYSAGEDVYKASITDIEKAAQILLVPQDLDHFNKVIATSTKKYKVEQVGLGYQNTRSKLYRLRTKFKERFSFLKAGATALNKEDVIPAINFKSGGLLNTWIDLTPIGSKKAFINRLIQGNYNDLDAVFSAFFAIVEETYMMGQNAMTYMMRVNQSANDASPAEGHEGYSQDNKRSGETKPWNSIKKDKHKMLYNMDLYDMDENEACYGQDRQETWWKPDDESEGDSGGMEEEMLHVMQKESVRPERQSAHSQICRKYLLDGKCDTQGCRYKHLWQPMQEERSKLVQKWGGQPLTILDDRRKETMKRRPLPRDPVPKNLAYMRKGGDEDDDEMESPGHEDGMEDCHLVASLFSVGVASTAWRAAHHVGLIRGGAGCSIKKTVTVLFDSGASGRNYISENLVKVLGVEREIQASEEKCRIAKGDIVKVRGRIQLELSFGTSEGQVLDFYILAGLGEEVILGIDDILLRFRELFIGMLRGEDPEGMLSHIKRLDESTNEGDLLEPWVTKGGLAEEEEVMAEAPFLLHFLEDSREEATKKFLGKHSGIQHCNPGIGVSAW